jgi:hypothetical protein
MEENGGADDRPAQRRGRGKGQGVCQESIVLTQKENGLFVPFADLEELYVESE